MTSQSDAQRLLDEADRARKTGRIDEAERILRYAASLASVRTAAGFALGNLLQNAGRLDEAIAAYRDALAQEPGQPFCQFNLGHALQLKGEPDQAETAFRAALALKPDMPRAHHALADIAYRRGDLQTALSGYQQAVALRPDFALAHASMGTALRDLGSYDEAMAAFQRALQLAPDLAVAHHDMGTTLQLMNRTEQAIDCYQRAIRLEPKYLSAFTNLGTAAYQRGDPETAHDAFTRARALNPAFPQARIGHVLGGFPPIYAAEQQITETRDRYATRLGRLVDDYRDADIPTLRAAADAVGLIQPFLLAYQGRNDRALQQTYGALMGRLMAARYPQWSMPLPPSPPAPGERIRIGFVSGYFRDHSNWKIPIRGWVGNLDRERFELYGYHTGTIQDTQTRAARDMFDVFVHGPLSVSRWSELIQAHELHVLIFPEFGMDPVTLKLGCLRLVPVQASSWGHPVTSGLDTVDYFLSSDLMEPDDAQEYYTERLVRLPNLSIHYTPPTVKPAAVTRTTLGIPEDAIFYWCCQSLFKYLPTYDDVLPRIAQRVPGCRFVFIEHPLGKATGIFRKRLDDAFARHGLVAADHVMFVKRMDTETFAGVTALADIFLDSIGWSGCNSTLEAIAFDTPLLTLPGKTMRSRHTAAILTMMGLTDLVAADEDRFVDLAARLGTDRAFREATRERVATRKKRLYGDRAPVDALARFLEAAARDGVPDDDAGDAVAPRRPRRHRDGARFLAAGRHFQDLGRLDDAAKAFRTGLALTNPAYARAAATDGSGLRSAPSFDDSGTVTVGEYRYPAIRPVEVDGQPRPFWSVVIPAYRRRDFLLECLASVLAQWRGADDMEIIVIDNGSEPSLEPLVQSIAGGIVRYRRHERTISLQDNWNSAVAASRGHWIHLLHDDDYVLPGFYDRLQQGIQSGPSTLGAAFTGFQNITSDRAVVFEQQVYGDYRGVARDWLTKISVGNILNPPAVVVSREAYERLGGYSTDILYTTDWELYLRIASFYDWWCEPDKLVHYRQHAQNVTAEQTAAGVQGDAFRMAIEMAQTYLPEPGRETLIARARANAFDWCIHHVAVPLRSGNTEGALRLIQSALSIDRSRAAIGRLLGFLDQPMAAALRAEIASRCPALSSRLSTGDVAGADALFAAIGNDPVLGETLVSELTRITVTTDDPALAFSRPDAARKSS